MRGALSAAAVLILGAACGAGLRSPAGVWVLDLEALRATLEKEAGEQPFGTSLVEIALRAAEQADTRLVLHEDSSFEARQQGPAGELLLRGDWRVEDTEVVLRIRETPGGGLPGAGEEWRLEWQGDRLLSRGGENRTEAVFRRLE